MTRIKALLRQPLLHFLMGGALLFLVYSILGDQSGAGDLSGRARSEERRIVVTRGQVESLASGFAGRWRRPPDENELAELVADYVRDEVLVREALAVGLDQGDAVIRRQLRLKMEFLARDVGSLDEPTEAELQVLLGQFAGRLSVPMRVSFRHIFLDPASRSETAAIAEAQRLLAALQGPASDTIVESAGDRFLLGYSFQELPGPEIDRRFGGDVATTLQSALVGRWAGPARSAYGLHLLLVQARADARLPPLDEVRPALRAEWMARRSRAALDAFVVGLVSRYAVKVEGTASGTVAAER